MEKQNPLIDTRPEICNKKQNSKSSKMKSKKKNFKYKNNSFNVRPLFK